MKLRTRPSRRQLPPGPRIPGAFNWSRPGSGRRPRSSGCASSYGKRITVQLPFQPPFVMLSDPEEIKELFTAPPEVLHPGEGARVLEPTVGSNSVILLDEDAHLEQRKLLLPAFHGEKMARLTGLMQELTERELDGWPTGEKLVLHPRLQRLTLEIILQGGVRARAGPAARRSARPVDPASSNSAKTRCRCSRIAAETGGWFGPLKRFQDLSARADEQIFDLIEERRAARSERDDVLGMLLEARHEDGSPMSPQELRDELMTALVAGHETTASQLAWAFERLSREPSVAQRLARGRR